MNIVKERTRIIFTDYTDLEKRKIEDLAATMDKVFIYEDPDDTMICLPTGMEESVKRAFPKIHITDNSKEYWEYANITPVEHTAEPRNQLQIDFIKFVLEQANKKNKVAGVLSPGTGKAQPLSTKIPTPTGYKTMGDVQIGGKVFGSDGKPIIVTGVYPQGIKDIYEITFDDERRSRCCLEHLWNVKTFNNQNYCVKSLAEIICNYEIIKYFIPPSPNNLCINTKSPMIIDISYIGQEEAQCIMVDSKDHLYLTENFIVTHNTFMACYAAIKLGIRTLIIVPTSGIKGQWGETLTGMFNVSADKVKLINSPKDFINIKADFAVVSQASLSVLNKTYDLEKIMKANRFGIKVIDEVQMWFHNIIKVDGNSNICHNWYLTGTFGRSSGEENTLYQQMFGDLEIFREKDKEPTLFNRKPGNVYGMKPHMNVKMVWTKSGLSPEEIRKVTSSMRYSERSGKWVRYGISIPLYTEMVIPSDGTLTKFLSTVLKVIKNANEEVDYGKMLILSPTIASVNVIFGYVKKIYPDKKIGTIHSRNTKAVNDKIKAECEILISTVKSCGTGFDVKDLSKLIVAEQFKSWILSDQVSGRLRRRSDGKDTYMWDIADAQIPQLRAWANARADVLRKKSKTFKVIDL